MEMRRSPFRYRFPALYPYTLHIRVTRERTASANGQVVRRLSVNWVFDWGCCPAPVGTASVVLTWPVRASRPGPAEERSTWHIGATPENDHLI